MNQQSPPDNPRGDAALRSAFLDALMDRNLNNAALWGGHWVRSRPAGARIADGMLYASAVWSMEAVRMVLAFGVDLPSDAAKLRNVAESAFAHRAFDCLRYVLFSPQAPALLNDWESVERLLFIGALNSNVEMLEVLAEFQVEIGREIRGARNVLHVAVTRDLEDASAVAQFERMVDFALTRGTRLEHEDGGGLTPLALAAQRGMTEKFAVLLSRGANPDGGRGIYKPARQAASHWMTPVLALLRDHGVDLAAATGGDTLLHDAMDSRERRIDADTTRESDLRAVMGLLRAAGVAIDAPNAQGTTPLMLAAQSGDASRVRLLLEAGANPNGRDMEGRDVDDYAVAAADQDATPDQVADVRAVLHAWRARNALGGMMAALGRPAEPTP